MGGIAFSSSFLRNDGRRARPAAFAVAWEEWPVSFDLEIEMIKSFCKILPRDDDDDDDNDDDDDDNDVNDDDDDYSCNSVNFQVRTSRVCKEVHLDNI